jgi:predicted nuclease of predicted toxin-antitoxin system
MRFLIDENLPDRLRIWRGPDYENVPRAKPAWPDERIWRYAMQHRFQAIVTKDEDFELRLLQLGPPPKVVRFFIGNMYLPDLDQLVRRVWPTVLELLLDSRISLVVINNEGAIDAS